MPNENFQPILDKLQSEVTNLALVTFQNYKNEAKTDALKLLDDMKENLKTWTLQLANGELSKDDFEFLVLAQKELIEMHALKQAGISLIQTDEFKNSLLNLFTKTILGFIKL